MPPKLHRLHPKTLLATSARPPLPTALIPTPRHSLGHTERQTNITVPRSKRHQFSSFNRPPPLYPNHVPITPLERLTIALGSTLYSFLSPRRADLIALCSETTTPISLLRSLRDVMLLSPTGRLILRERPRISSQTVDMSELRRLPEGTLGRTYVDWLDVEHVTPDTRDPVRHVPEEELAYVLQRYRESHDLYHVLLAEKGMPSFLEGEVVVKGFEFAALGLPMTGLAAFSGIKLPREQRRRVFWGGKGGAGDDSSPSMSGPPSSKHPASTSTSTPPNTSNGEPWILYALRQGLETTTSPTGSLLNVYWEKEWETPMSEIRERLGIKLPRGVGDLRAIRKKSREERKRMREIEGRS